MGRGERLPAGLGRSGIQGVGEMQCFCGCGKKVRLKMRSTNKRGKRLLDDAARIQNLLDQGLASPNASTFVEQASHWCQAFAAAVHDDTRPDEAEPGVSNTYLGWLREVTPFVGNAGVVYLGKRAREAGLQPDVAMALILAGDWDPYAGVRIPVPSLVDTE